MRRCKELGFRIHATASNSDLKYFFIDKIAYHIHITTAKITVDVHITTATFLVVM